MAMKMCMTRTVVKLLCPALFASLVFGSICFADDDEDDDGLPKKAHSLIITAPKKPKPKVIIKEKIVIQCPPGSNWNADVKRCQNEDGEDIAPAPKAKNKPQPRVAEEEKEPVPQQQAKSRQAPDDQYIYPRTKMRVRPGQCIMTGESMTCDFTYINTDKFTELTSKSTSIIDDRGNKYLATKVIRHGEASGVNWNCCVSYGNSMKVEYLFTYLDTKANSVTFSTVISANGQTDLIKLENFPITK